MKITNSNTRNQQLIKAGYTLLIILFLWIIGSKLYFRWDLTTEKRYTLSEDTKEFLKKLPDEVMIKIYLDGDLPSGFRKLKNSIQETLDEFRVYAGKNIQYEFINPSQNNDVKLRDQLYADLYDKGLRPTQIMMQGENGENSQQVIFPSALVSYGGAEIPVNFLKSNVGLSAEENLNNSIETIEYELIRPIHNFVTKKIDKVAFIEGHDELNEEQVQDIYQEIANSFDIYRGAIHGKPGVLDAYKVLVIARPQKEFSDSDKLVLDQYIMKGGRVLWLVDEVNANVDSLASGTTFAYINPTHVDDLLFTYGVRVNPILVQDFQCNIVPINVAARGAQAQWAPMPWLYYPLIPPLVNHPITRSLNVILARFPCYLDTVGTNGKVKKTPLLLTSPNTRLVKVPAMISLEEVRRTPAREAMVSGNKTIAILLEGIFPSLYRNRSAKSIISNYPGELVKESKPTKMIMISCGDMIRNDVRMTPQGPLPGKLGYDRYTRQTFGNKDFLMNCIQYLADDAGLMNLRTKTYTLRLLDKQKIREEKLKWQLINTLLPLFLVIIFGLFFYIRRKAKYAKQ